MRFVGYVVEAVVDGIKNEKDIIPGMFPYFR